MGKNYHVELTEDKTYYSVPFDYTGQEVKMKYSESVVEIYYKGERIALTADQSSWEIHYSRGSYACKS